MQHFGDNSHLNNRVKNQNQQGETDVKDLNEQDLIALCKNNDRKAQKVLYDMFSPKMFALCHRYLGNRQAAEDTLQEGFITVFAKIGSYSGEGSFEGWVRKIFVNTALMNLRKNDVLKQTEDIDTAFGVSDSTPSTVQDISFKELIKLIATLPPGFRTVFNMFVIEGYNHKEIGQALGISEATSRSQLQRARTLLQKKIKEYIEH